MLLMVPASMRMKPSLFTRMGAVAGRSKHVESTTAKIPKAIWQSLIHIDKRLIRKLWMCWKTRERVLGKLLRQNRANVMREFLCLLFSHYKPANVRRKRTSGRLGHRTSVATHWVCRPREHTRCRGPPSLVSKPLRQNSWRGRHDEVCVCHAYLSPELSLESGQGDLKRTRESCNTEKEHQSNIKD